MTILSSYIYKSRFSLCSSFLTLENADVRRSLLTRLLLPPPQAPGRARRATFQPPNSPGPPKVAPFSLLASRPLSVAVVLTGSFSEPPLWQFRYQIEDVSRLVLAPELRGLQVPTSHHTEESPSLTPQAGSPRSPAKDRPPPEPGTAAAGTCARR